MKYFQYFIRECVFRDLKHLLQPKYQPLMFLFKLPEVCGPWYHLFERHRLSPSIGNAPGYIIDESLHAGYSLDDPLELPHSLQYNDRVVIFEAEHRPYLLEYHLGVALPQHHSLPHFVVRGQGGADVGAKGDLIAQFVVLTLQLVQLHLVLIDQFRCRLGLLEGWQGVHLRDHRLDMGVAVADLLSQSLHLSQQIFEVLLHCLQGGSQALVLTLHFQSLLLHDLVNVRAAFLILREH